MSRAPKHLMSILLGLNEAKVNELKFSYYANRTESNRVRRSNVCSGQRLSRATATNNKPCRKMWAYKMPSTTYRKRLI